MKRFTRVLSEARDQLKIPEPSRTRVLLEMASDLEDSYQFHLSQGCDESEAAHRAKEAFGTSEEALKHLSRIHETSLGGVQNRLSGQIGRFWEKALLVIIFVFEILATAKVVSHEAFFMFMSPFVWLIGGLAAAAFVLTTWKLYQIFFNSGSDVRQIREGLGALLFFAGASLAVTGCGFLFHIQRFFRLNYEMAPESLFMNFAGWMATISFMMTLGLLVAMLTALIWFVLFNLAIRSERREVEALLGRKGSTAKRRGRIRAILFWGFVVVLLGFLGQWLGVMKMIMATVEPWLASPMRFIQEAGPLILPVILLFVVIAILAIRNAVALIRSKGSMAKRRGSIDAILFWGSVAALLGFLGQWLGVMKLITVMVEHGLASPKLVVLGVSESLQTPLGGMVVFVVSAFLWFFLRVGLWTKERRV